MMSKCWCQLFAVTSRRHRRHATYVICTCLCLGIYVALRLYYPAEDAVRNPKPATARNRSLPDIIHIGPPARNRSRVTDARPDPLDRKENCSTDSGELDAVAGRLSTVCDETSGRLGTGTHVVSNSKLRAVACKLLTCRALLIGDKFAQELLTTTSGLVPHIAPPEDLELVRDVSDCAAYRRFIGFHDTVDPSVADFPLAFNLVVHRDAHQVARLLRAIYRPNNVYCIHVDARSKRDFRAAMSALVACFDNVHLASRLENITWAGYSRLQADINCMRDHVHGGRDWKYLINTAGQAFPLKTIEQIVRILRIYNGSNDIEGIYGKRVLRYRFEYEWVENAKMRKMERTGRKNDAPPHEIDIVRGSAYGVFSRPFVQFVLLDRKSRDLLEWSRRTWSPDEFYWATLHHAYANPHIKAPGSYSGHPSQKPWLAVYVNWNDKRCHGRRVRGVCVFGVGDLPRLLTRHELFANKFYADFQPLALDCLEAWIRHKEQCPPSELQDDLNFYWKLPFVRNGTN